MDGTAITTATGTEDANTDGVAIAITVFTTVKRLGRVWLPVLFHVARWLPMLLGTLRRLSFIHFARWTIVRKLPYNGAPQPQQTLVYPHLFFESNFNGGWEEYIDAFSYILTRGMAAFWKTSYGFPGALPTPPFKQYIRDNQLTAQHYYSAYPDATATMVSRALQLEDKLQAFRLDAPSDPVEFETRWKAFLHDVEGCL